MRFNYRFRGAYLMIKVNLVAVGKVKERYFSDGINEYAKRLSRFCEFKIIEVKEENFEKVDSSLIDIIKKREAERILPYVKGYTVVTAIEGKKISSTDFAKILKTAGDGSGVITVIVGGSYGLDDSIKKLADCKISFSDMTFPHTMFRLMLTEQLYRAFCINGGSNYHK